MFKDLGWSWSLVSYISWTLKRGMFGRNFHDWTELLLFLWERSAGDKKTCLKKNTGARWLRLSTNTIIKVTGAWEKWWLCWSLYTCSISCLCHFSNSVAQSERENRSEVRCKHRNSLLEIPKLTIKHITWSLPYVAGFCFKTRICGIVWNRISPWNLIPPAPSTPT